MKQANSSTKRPLSFAVTAGTLLCLLLLSSPAEAQSFTFQFKNPGFGGYPANFHYFMATAEVQKPDFKGQEAARFGRTPMDDFQRTMQRQLLSQLSRQLVQGELEDLDLTSEGIYDLGDFTIRILPGLDVISIEIQDQLSGERSHVEIPRF